MNSTRRGCARWRRPGKISYWSILFGARSFSDLLDKIDMIQEIAKADQLMMEKLKAMSEKIAGERADLETQMDDLNAAKDELAVQAGRSWRPAGRVRRAADPDGEGI